MSTASYSRILYAVGQALDLAGARSFSVRESETGVWLDLVDAQGERVTRDLSLADIEDLMRWSDRARSEPELVTNHRDEGVLQRLLERRERERELVGAR